MWTLGLLLALLALVPLAYASPPDPVWLAGIYDGADADEVVLAATSLESGVGQGFAVSCQIMLLRAGVVPAPESGWPNGRPRCLAARAPPIA